MQRGKLKGNSVLFGHQYVWSCFMRWFSNSQIISLLLRLKKKKSSWNWVWRRGLFFGWINFHQGYAFSSIFDFTVDWVVDAACWYLRVLQFGLEQFIYFAYFADIVLFADGYEGMQEMLDSVSTNTCKNLTQDQCEYNEIILHILHICQFIMGWENGRF